MQDAATLREEVLRCRRLAQALPVDEIQARSALLELAGEYETRLAGLAGAELKAGSDAEG